MAVDIDCDVAVIGAGTAGLAAERGARRTGARTLLIDPAFNGTTCATVGCMPSKLLIAAAAAAHGAATAATFGIRADPVIDGAAVFRRLRAERDRFAAATREEIAKLPAGIAIRGKARFISPTTLALDDGRTIGAKAIVIATGATPSVPDAFAAIADRVLTNESVFELETLPETLAVIGAGPLGLELAQAMARLGVSVTLLDQSGRIGGVADETIARHLTETLARDFAIHLDVGITAEMAGGQASLRWSGASAGAGRFDRVLVAAGRPANLAGLDLDRAGLALDDKGTPVFDRDTMRCGDSAIYIAGDADAERPVLHEASSEGAIAGASAARHPHPHPAARSVPFSIMFTDPPLCTIGREEGPGIVTGEADYGDQGRARIENRAAGLARLHADHADGRLVGATLFCPGADHLGHLLAWSIEAGATADVLLDRPFYHPTLEEGLKPALRSLCRQLGLTPPEARDEGAPPGA